MLRLSLLACLSVAFAAITVCAEEPQADAAKVAAAVQRVEERGGKVEYDDAKHLIRVDLFERQTKNDDLALLAALVDLEKLSLWGAGINDTGLAQLAGLPKLKVLVVENTEITDDGVKALSAIKSLKSLNLRRSTYLSDAGLAYVRDLPNLEQLHLLYNNI